MRPLSTQQVWEPCKTRTAAKFVGIQGVRKTLAHPVPSRIFLVLILDSGQKPKSQVRTEKQKERRCLCWVSILSSRGVGVLLNEFGVTDRYPNGKMPPGARPPGARGFRVSSGLRAGAGGTSSRTNEPTAPQASKPGGDSGASSHVSVTFEITATALANIGQFSPQQAYAHECHRLSASLPASLPEASHGGETPCIPGEVGGEVTDQQSLGFPHLPPKSAGCPAQA